MLQIIKLAWRDLNRNRRRSFFSALALGMGLSLLLLMAAVIEYEIRSSMDTSIRLQTGHLQIRAASYNENRSSLAWEDLVEGPAAIAVQVAALPPVSVATPRLFASGIVASGDTSAAARITGVDPASAANDPYRSGILSGQWLGADDRDGIVIGQPMADKLGLKAGDKPNVLVNTANGDVDSQAFVIRGIYSTRTPGFDNGTIFMSLAKAQAITRAGDHASAIFVLLKDRDQTGAVVAALQTRQFTVLTWDRMNALLSDTEELANSYMILLYLIILAITATVIVNTLVMAVFERTREIGILSALGMRSGRIMAMFFAESAMLALGGIALGLIIGGAMVAYFGSVGYYIGDYGMTDLLFGERIYAVLTLKDAINLSIAALLVTLVASVYPASLAARLEPVEALRGGRQA